MSLFLQIILIVHSRVSYKKNVCEVSSIPIVINQSTIVFGPPASSRNVTCSSVLKDTPLLQIFPYLKHFKKQCPLLFKNILCVYLILPSSSYVRGLYFHFWSVGEHSSLGMFYGKRSSAGGNWHFYAVFQIRKVYCSINGYFHAEIVILWLI